MDTADKKKTQISTKTDRAEKEKGERTRLQFEFSPQALARLEDIRRKVDARSNADVVRAALRLYDWFIDQEREGYKILVGKGDDVREVELLFGG